MRSIYLFLVLGFLLTSCQNQEPDELKLQQQAKSKDTQVLEDNFAKAVDKTATTLAAEKAIYSPAGKTAIRSGLATIMVPTATTSTTPYQVLSAAQLAAVDSAIVLADQLGQVKNGAMLLKVRDYEAAYAAIQSMQSELGFDIVSEKQNTTTYSQENTLQLMANPAQFDAIMNQLGDMAAVIRKKEVWQNKPAEDYLDLQADLMAQNRKVKAIEKQLKIATTNRLTLQQELATANGELQKQVGKATTLATALPQSTLIISVFESGDLAKPLPKSFNASFGDNLNAGWQGFQVFLLQVALYWPYVLIGTIFLLTMLIASATTKRRERKFRLQALQAQQQLVLQKARPNPTVAATTINQEK